MQSDKGAYTHARNGNNQKPLDSATQNDITEVVSLLMKTGILIGRVFNSLLFKVIEKSNHKILKILINYGIQYNQSMNFKTLLNAAILQGNSLIIEAIIPHCGFSKPSDQYIPRKVVIETDSRYRECIELLLKWNFTIDPNSCDDESFICAAVENGYSQIILQLLKYGIDVNMVNSETELNILTTACLNKHHEVVDILLKHNADVNHPDKNMMTPLHVASCGENLKIIEMLLNKGVNLNARNDKGLTPLHLACQVMNNNILDIIQLLLEHGANIDAVDAKGWTPLFIAYEKMNYNAVRYLLDHHANPNHIDSENLTLLHIAIQQISDTNDMVMNHYRLIQLLIKYGARVDVSDGTNRTPLYYVIGKVILHSNSNSRPSSPENYYYYYCKYRGVYEVIKNLLSQGIKLKTAGLTVNNHSLNAVFNPDQYITIDFVKYLANDILQFNGISFYNDVDNRDNEVSDDEGSNENFSDEEIFIGDIREIKIMCEREIEGMKTTKIGIDDLTLHDLLI